MKNLDSICRRQSPSALDSVPEVFPAQELHDDKGFAGLDVAEVEHLNDIAMADSGGGASFLQQAVRGVGVLNQGTPKHLERNLALAADWSRPRPLPCRLRR